MASNIQAFVSIPALANNAHGAVATIGELSTEGRTYAIEKQYVADDAYPGQELVVFSASTDGVNKYNLTASFCKPALEITKLIKEEFDGSSELLAFLKAKTGDKYSNFVLGSIVLHKGVRLPRSLQFDHTDNGTVTFQLWYSDETFQNEYEGAELKIIPPAFPVSALYDSYDKASKAVMDMDYATIVEKEEEIRNDKPFTKKTVFKLKWVDPTNGTLSFNTNWTVLGYGKQSLRTDLILEAIRKYLTDNTIYTISQWKEYLPDIKSIDTFDFVPMWDAVSLTAGPNLDSLYRPIMTYADVVDKMTNIMPTRNTEEVQTYSEFFPIVYRNLGIMSISGTGNVTDKRFFSKMFPDYSPIDFSDQNAGRLDAKTQSIIQTIELLVRSAETDDGTQTLPTTISRRVIGGATFLEKADNQVIYRLCTRKSYMKLIGA